MWPVTHEKVKDEQTTLVTFRTRIRSSREQTQEQGIFCDKGINLLAEIGG